ncbi:MOSC N-terminal beta barrel domain-containing protein [Kineococcus sp. SYSU DK002]|uniref:MOSC N-terminal beta barrel domain-containing protein n=1 Tax=Kineococcus sp. SYSU DK002 TaxID=3383123 RepID=UPI003D7E6598
MSVTGTLREIGLFPVKSTRGLFPPAVTVGPDGLDGDRAFAVLDTAGDVLAAKRHPALARLTPVPTPAGPRLLVPGDVPLADFLAVPGAAVGPVPGGARQVAPVHVVTVRQRAAPGAGDTSRANLVLDLPGADEPPAADWVGRGLRVGAVHLEVVAVPRHCGGAFARVLTPGPVRVGDVAELLAAGHG